MKTPHQILGLPEGATFEEVKKAFRTLAKKYHPDIDHSKGAANRFRELKEAYDRIVARGIVDNSGGIAGTSYRWTSDNIATWTIIFE